ncbi:MAG: manganese efflux pump MntP family protein [Faecalibacterium prausnitzii]
MEWSFLFFFNSALLGVGLAMDAFSVSMANGLHDPQMSRRRGVQIAGTFGIFQAVMPMTGWVCVHTIVELFSSFEKFIPWIALILLGYIGGKMLIEGIKGEEAEEAAELSAGALFMQGVATSIDALSVGFTISEYGWFMALVCSLIVAIVTFFICEAGLAIGKSSAPSSPAKPPSSAASSSSASVWRSSFPASWAEKNSSAPAHLCRGAVLCPREAPAGAGRKFAVFYCILPQNRGF